MHTLNPCEHTHRSLDIINAPQPSMCVCACLIKYISGELFKNLVAVGFLGKTPNGNTGLGRETDLLLISVLFVCSASLKKKFTPNILNSFQMNP